MRSRRAGLAVLVSTLALTAWGLLFWGLLYQYVDVYRTLPGDRRVLDLLVAQGTATGTYFVPWPRNTPETFAAFLQQHRSGPFFQLSYIREGIDPQAPGKLALGLLHYLLVTIVAAALLALATPAAAPWWRRGLVVMMAGLLGTLFIRLGDPIWFHLPWHFALGQAVYEVVAWLILGSLLAALVRR